MFVKAKKTQLQQQPQQQQQYHLHNYRSDVRSKNVMLNANKHSPSAVAAGGSVDMVIVHQAPVPPYRHHVQQQPQILQQQTALHNHHSNQHSHVNAVNLNNNILQAQMRQFGNNNMHMGNIYQQQQQNDEIFHIK